MIGRRRPGVPDGRGVRLPCGDAGYYISRPFWPDNIKLGFYLCMFVVSEDGKWYRVSLRLMGDSLPVEEIESLIGLAPDSLGRKGEHLRGDPRSVKHHANIWVSKYLVNSDVPFEEQITGLLDVLEPKLGALKEILSLPDVRGELFLGFSSRKGQGGAVFSPELLRRVADYGLSLSLDLYPPGGDDAKG